MLLFGQQKEQLACKKLSGGMLAWKSAVKRVHVCMLQHCYSVFLLYIYEITRTRPQWHVVAVRK